jgi:hypothetical protein
MISIKIINKPHRLSFEQLFVCYNHVSVFCLCVRPWCACAQSGDVCRNDTKGNIEKKRKTKRICVYVFFLFFVVTCGVHYGWDLVFSMHL